MFSIFAGKTDFLSPTWNLVGVHRWFSVLSLTTRRTRCEINSEKWGKKTPPIISEWEKRANRFRGTHRVCEFERVTWRLVEVKLSKVSVEKHAPSTIFISSVFAPPCYGRIYSDAFYTFRQRGIRGTLKVFFSHFRFRSIASHPYSWSSIFFIKKYLYVFFWPTNWAVNNWCNVSLTTFIVSIRLSFYLFRICLFVPFSVD